MPPNIIIAAGWTMPPGGNQTQQGWVGPAGYGFPAHLEVILPQNFAGAVIIIPNDQIPPFMTSITISAFSTTALGVYSGKLKVTGPDGSNWYDILIVVQTAPPGQLYGLTISVQGSGTTIPPVGNNPYLPNTTASVTASPSQRWWFQTWTLDGKPTDRVAPNITVLMDADHTLVAVFNTDDRTRFLAWWNSLPTWQKVLVAGGIPVTMLGVLIANKRKR